ncbi:bifunctional diguanylate cyclase/phosphodiesterase [Mesorhizobium sp. CAU 1732]|uniref:putative bifunctional diguanylate cyclase/phosphodiesterase n=1 Tax=Mesorhizobium sp. CAU 1732 TaxID=3140358 RepID=UPI003260CF36
MDIFSSIRTHSQRGYHAVQAMLAAGAAATGLSIALDWRIRGAGEIAFAGIAIGLTVFCMVILHHLRMTLQYRLSQAAIAEEGNQRLLKTDALTNALTRRYFLDEFRIRLGNPLKANTTVLLLVDFDHFKQLNDSYGHPFGDTALCELVVSLRRYFPQSLIGRLGGDEFAVLLENDDVAMVRERAAQLLHTLQDGISYEGRQISMSASIGAAVSPFHASQSKDLMLLADTALYESKANGRGRLTIFDPEMLSDQRHRRFIERELRAAIYLNQLEVHYQPIVNADGKPYAVEGLVRWRHQVRGLISPGDFIPVAERSGLIDEVGAWVFKRACLDTASFDGLRISINVSGRQLKNTELVAMFEKTLRETGCLASQFVLEITETAATAATPDVLARLDKLREMGFRIALDDFGTGHCGFNYLKTLPIDSIKIDRSYIQNLGTDHVARVFVSALAEIARVQNVTIVAEGVETQEEWDLARAAGCTRFQGYFISRPQPKEMLERGAPTKRLAVV